MRRILRSSKSQRKSDNTMGSPREVLAGIKEQMFEQIFKQKDLYSRTHL